MVRRYLLSFAVISAGLPLIYLTASILLTVFAANPDWQEPQTGIPIYVVTNGAHADVIVPLQGPTWDWRTRIPAAVFPMALDKASHLAFGWGDRRIFLETPTWSDLTIANAVTALMWPSVSAVHVGLLSEPERLAGAYRIVLDDAQFQILDNYIAAAFMRDDSGNVMPIAGAHYTRADAFFEGEGAYTLFYTCNNWVGEALARAGVRVGRWTPFEFNLLYHLASE